MELRREIWVQEVHLGIVMRIVFEAMGFNDVTGGNRSFKEKVSNDLISKSFRI